MAYPERLVPDCLECIDRCGTCFSWVDLNLYLLVIDGAKCVWTPVSAVGGNSVMITTILAVSMVVRSTLGGTQLWNNLPQPVR